MEFKIFKKVSYILINFQIFNTFSFVIRFKWSHLTEQMNYEKALVDQKLRIEMRLAKKEASFQAHMIERSRKKKQIFADPNRSYKQRETDEQIQAEKEDTGLDDQLMADIFK